MFSNQENVDKLSNILNRYQRQESEHETGENVDTKILQPNDNYEEEGNFPNGLPDIDDYHIWPEGPLKSQIEAWINIFKTAGLDVGLSEFPSGERFIWRSISRTEYKAITSAPNTTGLIREEMITELCTLWPEVYDYEVQASAKGGIPGALAKTIMQSSGFVEPKTTLL